ncbi:MAG TPA: PEP-CTERM sorting domain-containing protein [Vicinamibacterales bacterium]|jgi:hypothetical protein
MRKLVLVLCAVLVLGFGASAASADTIRLNDWILKINSATYDAIGNPILPGNVNAAGFDFGTGLGTIVVSLSTPGNYSLIGYFDHDITGDNNPWDNEWGVVHGAPVAGQSYQMDVPGCDPLVWDHCVPLSSLYPNITAGALDNTNHVGSPGLFDVAMALGWNFSLDADHRAVLTFHIGETLPASAFFLNQHDPLPAGTQGQDIYYSSTLDIVETGPGVVPEPSTMLLVGTGLIGLARLGRRKKK